MSRSALFHVAALEIGRLAGEGAVGGHRADQRRAVAVDEPGLLDLEHVEVDFAEGRGLVDHARARVDGHEIRGHDPPGDVLAAAAAETPAGLAGRAVVVAERRQVTQPQQVAA